MVLPEGTVMANLTMKEMAANTKDFIRGIKEAFSSKPFLRLCGATFFVFNGYQTIAQFAYYIIVFYLFKGNTEATGQWPAWFGTVSALSTAFLVIPIITFISTRIGKRKAFILATFISMVGYALKWWGFNPANPYLMFLPLPLISFGIGGLFTLMMSMTADVCDLDELNNGTRREGTFGAVYWWMVKLGNALALLIGGAVLSLVGFDVDATEQSVQTVTSLRIADIVIPVILAACAILIMWKYDITEKKANEIRQALIARRGRVKHQE
jgi:GPH family glycoside/pentoside/hexuronide:cation symporter